MIYYKDINGNIYTGDKADYRDKELTEQELETYLAEQQKQANNSEIYRKLDEIDSESVRPLRACIVALLDSKVPEKADSDSIISKEKTAKAERVKIKK